MQPPESDPESSEEPLAHKPHRQPRITPRRVVAVIGFGLIAKGYDMMSIAPDAPVQEALDGGIFGILAVIAGAGLAIFALFFNS